MSFSFTWPGTWLARALVLLIAAAISPVASVAGEYLLGPQDRLRLKIYEWRASRDTIFEWTALNDVFTVGANGALSLPFVGEILAAGETPQNLGRQIGNRLMLKMGLGREPDVAVEIVQFRPFYIVGQITTPGEFPYRPGLTVLQAVSIAGGILTREKDRERLEREVIAGRGEIDMISFNTVSLLARKSRLEAEAAGLPEITFPETISRLADAASASIIMQQEKAIFVARKDALQTQIRALQGLKEFLVQELTSLKTQLTFHDRQIALVEKELSGVTMLVQKGYSSAPREISLQRTLADVQSSRLSAETALLRARQELSRTDLSILELKNNFANEVAGSLRDTQAQLEENSRKADTAVKLLHDSELSAPRLLALRTEAQKAAPIYVIVRPDGDRFIEMQATETTPVAPGDTLKVEIPLPERLDSLEFGISAVESPPLNSTAQ